MNFPPFPDDVLDVLRDYSAYRLSSDADCMSPDSPESAGAQFLASVRDGVVERLESFDADEREAFYRVDETVDLVHEVADSAPDVYTHTMWSEFIDLGAYQEDPSEYGADASDMDNAARVCLYIIAERLASSLVSEARGLYANYVDEQDDSDD